MSSTSSVTSLYATFPFNYSVAGVPAGAAFAVAIMAVGFYARFTAIEQYVFTVDAERLKQSKKLFLLMQEENPDVPASTTTAPNNSSSTTNKRTTSPSANHENNSNIINNQSENTQVLTTEQRETWDLMNLYAKQLEIAVQRSHLLRR